MSGMVLFSTPYGEYDRRVVLLTKEAGKITAFARGARKPTSHLLAATAAFNAGTFSLFPGRSAYTLTAARITNYFENLKADLDGACYASYFAEMAGYYGQENLDATDILNLLYAALRALERKDLDNALVRCVFEAKLMSIGGEFPVKAAEDKRLGQSAAYALRFCIASPAAKLFSFSLAPDALEQLRTVVDEIREKTIETKMKSLEILETMVNP